MRGGRIDILGVTISPIHGTTGIGQIDRKELNVRCIIHTGGIVEDTKLRLNNKQRFGFGNASSAIIGNGRSEISSEKGVIVLVIEIGIGGAVIDWASINEPMYTESSTISGGSEYSIGGVIGQFRCSGQSVNYNILHCVRGKKSVIIIVVSNGVGSGLIKSVVEIRYTAFKCVTS
jgi:hypothetical protein